MSMGEAQEDNDEQVDNAAQLMGGTEMAVDGEAAGVILVCLCAI